MAEDNLKEAKTVAELIRTEIAIMPIEAFTAK